MTSCLAPPELPVGSLVAVSIINRRSKLARWKLFARCKLGEAALCNKTRFASCQVKNCNKLSLLAPPAVCLAGRLASGSLNVVGLLVSDRFLLLEASIAAAVAVAAAAGATGAFAADSGGGNGSGRGLSFRCNSSGSCSCTSRPVAATSGWSWRRKSCCCCCCWASGRACSIVIGTSEGGCRWLKWYSKPLPGCPARKLVAPESTVLLLLLLLVSFGQNRRLVGRCLAVLSSQLLLLLLLLHVSVSPAKTEPIGGGHLWALELPAWRNYHRPGIRKFRIQQRHFNN